LDTLNIFKMLIIAVLLLYVIIRYISTGSVLNLFLLFSQGFSAAFIFLKDLNKTEINNELYYSILFLAILFPAITLFNDVMTNEDLKKKNTPLYKFHHYANKEIDLDTNELIEYFSAGNIAIYDKNCTDLKKIYDKVNIMVRQKDLVKAAAIYEILLDINKKNPVIRFNYGCILYKQEKFNEAFNTFLRTNALIRASKITKKRRGKLLSSSYYNAGNSLYHMNKIREAMYCYKKALKFNSGNILARENQVILQLAGSNLRDALKIYKESIKKQNPAFLYNLHLFMGKAFEKRNEMNEALESYRNAKDIRKASPVMHSIARILYGMDRTDEAVREYEEMRSLFPEDEKVCYGLGLAYYRKGDIEKAKKSFKIIINLREAKYNYAYILYKNSEFHASLALIDDLLNDRPGIEDYKLAGSLYMRLGRYYEAIRSFVKAYEIDPDNYKTAYNLGLAYAMIKDNHTARQYFENAYLLNKNDVDILINLIKINIKVNDIAAAKKYSAENKDILDASESGRELLNGFD
jgi:tetratricopeptide (TPR) repeat protein